VLIQGAISKDIYAAGGTVDILAEAEGDVVVAGGRVLVGASVSGDVMAAGGAVAVRAAVADDVRLAGGDVRLSGVVGDGAIVAGGNVSLTPDSKVGGRAWISGGRIDVAGEIGQELKAVGGRIVLSGQINGDVTLRGRDIRLLDSAIIQGDLVYASPREAEIASGAQIRGNVEYKPVKRPMAPVIAALFGLGILLLLSLLITGMALFLLFPQFIDTAIASMRKESWKCLGLGLALFAATPMVISVLFVTVIGWLPAIVVGALYMLLILVGLLTGVFSAGDLGLRMLGRNRISRTARLVSFILALMLIMLLGLVPLLGTLLVFGVVLFGMGEVSLALYRNYLGQAQ
jgi:hypothetical protein